jgi:two-component system cell cycle sensor histidine kinase/response regulator CckA
MMMPVMDGPTSIRALQAIDPEVKVVGISGLGSEAVLIRAAKLSVQRFLKKPYAIGDFLTSLREVLNEEI